MIGDKMKIEVGKKYKVRSDSSVRYVEIVYAATGGVYDFVGNILRSGGVDVLYYKADGGRVSRKARGSYWLARELDRWDIVEEYKEEV